MNQIAPNSLLLSSRDIDFLLYEWLGVEALTGRDRYSGHSRYTFDAVLELAQSIATEHFAPHNKANDASEPTFDGGRVGVVPEVGTALRVFGTTGLLASHMDEAIGGGQLPRVVAFAMFAWFQAANIATAAYPFLTMANANLLVAYGTEEQIELYVRPMVEGRFYGTMCLSESEAGSSLSDIRTRAEAQSDGTYRLFGNKMWISGGDHELSENIIHLVLARIPGGPAGVKGLSLFIVPKVIVNADGRLGERNDVVLMGLNHKMGYRGTTNTLLRFGDGGFRPAGDTGAIGYLVGEPDKGLAYTFHMMNEARIGVGSGATALGYTAYLKSLEYARSRLQGRPIAAKDPTSPQVPIIEHADVRRMLLAQKSYVEGALALVLYCGRLLDEETTATSMEDRTRAHRLLDVLTPIAKSWPAQWCLQANSLAIQIHGGYGYTRDYDVEQHYRDNRLNAIHEGTHGIQAIDLLGRKMAMDGGLQVLGDAIRASLDDAEKAGGEVSQLAVRLREAVERVEFVTAILTGAGDLDARMANASLYLEAVGHVVVAWMWLEQVLATSDHEGEFYEGKRQAARYFYRYELVKTASQFELLASVDRTALEMDGRWF
jgi:alkylation response protein AidB-like acyl-CoA dehydrogenase